MTSRDAAIIEARAAGKTLREIAAEHGISASTVRRVCLDAEKPFRVFLGWDDRQAEACYVAMYSIGANSTIPVEVTFLNDGACGDFGRVGVTKFTYRRFLVPSLCGYQGRALFADGADTLILGDVAELASFDLGGRALARVKYPPPPGQDRSRGDTSVMLMDCARCSVWTPEVVATASDDRLMRLRDFADDEIADLDPRWNAALKVGEEPPLRTYIAHWGSIAPLCPPEAGDWIDFSRSKAWAGWRQRMRAGW